MGRVDELIALRTKMGMNRKEFCEYFVIPYRTMVDWEAGKNTIPEYLLRLMIYKAYAEKMCDESRMLNRKLTDLEMANKKDHKVLITDEAIKKVPYIAYPEIDEAQYGIIQVLARKTLEISKERNNSAEIALTYDLDNAGELNEDAIGIAVGGEHEVDPLSDTQSYHIIMGGKSCTILTVHNHPSLQDFSLSDIYFLINYANIKMMVVVTNQGKISYLVKGKKYNRKEAFELFYEAMQIYSKARNLKGLMRANNTFLHNCGNAGIIYGDR